MRHASSSGDGPALGLGAPHSSQRSSTSSFHAPHSSSSPARAVQAQIRPALRRTWLRVSSS